MFVDGKSVTQLLWKRHFNKEIFHVHSSHSDNMLNVNLKRFNTHLSSTSNRWNLSKNVASAIIKKLSTTSHYCEELLNFRNGQFRYQFSFHFVNELMNWKDKERTKNTQKFIYKTLRKKMFAYSTAKMTKNYTHTHATLLNRSNSMNIIFIKICNRNNISYVWVLRSEIAIIIWCISFCLLFLCV